MHAYVDGELAGVDYDTYEKHLLECDHCSRCCRLQARFKAEPAGAVTVSTFPLKPATPRSI